MSDSLTGTFSNIALKRIEVGFCFFAYAMGASLQLDLPNLKRGEPEAIGSEVTQMFSWDRTDFEIRTMPQDDVDLLLPLQSRETRRRRIASGDGAKTPRSFIFVGARRGRQLNMSIFRP